MHIALFGGSFNPIHTGHLAIAQAAVTRTDIDRVWLMVSPQNPFKVSERLLDDATRLRLVAAATEGIDHIVCSDYEFHLPKPSYTYLTLKALAVDYPHDTFSLLIGADNYLAFSRWAHYDEILYEHHIYIYPRRGYDLDSAALPTTVHLLQMPYYDVSSTALRQAIANAEDISGLVPPQVHRIIINEQLYQ